MIHILRPLPKILGVAVSGGPDSMAALHFFSRTRKVIALHFSHELHSSCQETQSSFRRNSKDLVLNYCKSNSITCYWDFLRREREKDESVEEYWRNERYRFFHSQSLPIITAHHLDDCVETWLWSCFHGTPKIIPYRNRNVIRPFLLTKKEVLRKYCDKHNVPYLLDPSNEDTSHRRNYIRKKIIPQVLEMNPGIHKVIRKKIKNDK
jgi:tRNA(Ile)-lysidine synthase